MAIDINSSFKTIREDIANNLANVDRSDAQNNKFASILDDGEISMDEIESFSYEEMNSFRNFQKENDIYAINGVDVGSGKLIGALSATPNEEFNKAYYNSIKNLPLEYIMSASLELEVNLADYFIDKDLVPRLKAPGTDYHNHDLLNDEQKAQINYSDFARTLLNMFDNEYENTKDKEYKEYTKTFRDMYSNITAELNKTNSPYA